MSAAQHTSAPRLTAATTAMRVPVAAFRACELCTHSTARSDRLVCDSPAVRLVGRPASLDVARSATGSCGPNARHLDMPGWH